MTSQFTTPLIRRRAIPVASAVAAIVATLALAGQAPHFEISPDDVLLDERFRVALAGLTANQEVTILVDGNRGMWHSSGTFRSDAQGRVEIPDPMRLIWSATGERRPAQPNAAPAQPWTFSAQVDGKVIATQTVTRRAVADNVRVVPVRERGLVGTAYYPADPGRRPAMIVLPGSQGGIPGPASPSGGLASRGYVVLSLAYFNAEGLPPLLNNIPLEYFATAVDWLKSQPQVDPDRIGVLGTSRGGELALLLGATYPSSFRVVVANVPSSLVWPGLSDDSETPAWTLNGKPLATMESHFGPADLTLSGRERFLKRMQDAGATRRAEIPVERIGGPLLMFSGKDDQLWPSDVFAARVIERLKEHKFAHPVEHYSYEDAGHMIARPYVPTSDVREVRIHPVSKRPNMAGGTPEGQARANEDAWQRLLAFLDRHLRAPTSSAGQMATRIVMLGTGTPRINPDRSGPATAIVVGDRAYLVDIGPGVVRRAAAAAAAGLPAVDPTNISTAFITHLHSDHTAGYPDLMLMPWIFGRKTLDVYGPEGTEEMTKYLLMAYRRDIEVRTTGMEQRGPLIARAHDVTPGVVFKDDRVTVKAFKVPHGDWPQAFGYRFETPDRVIVISGDTSPSDEIVANCRPCDVLIHEVQLPDYNVASMPDWKAYRARYHTMTDQLAELANRAKPGLLVAYHNGGTPDAISLILEQIQRTYKGKVVVARDLDVF